MKQVMKKIKVTFVIVILFSILSMIIEQNYDYGSYWGGIIGGVIGGALTIIGVYWTINDLQKERREEQKNKIRQSATIIFYDFKFAKNELVKFNKDNFGTDEKCNTKSFYNIFIDKDWLARVSILVYEEKVSEDELELIYTIYGMLEYCICYLNASQRPIDFQNHLNETIDQLSEFENKYMEQLEDLMKTKNQNKRKYKIECAHNQL